MMNPDYWRGFNDGKRAGEKEAREKAAGVLAFYLESLKEVKGIGDTLYQRIVEHINTVEVFDTDTNQVIRKGEENA